MNLNWIRAAKLGVEPVDPFHLVLCQVPDPNMVERVVQNKAEADKERSQSDADTNEDCSGGDGGTIHHGFCLPALCDSSGQFLPRGNGWVWVAVAPALLHHHDPPTKTPPSLISLYLLFPPRINHFLY